jgi:hypothetical protein
MHGNMDGLAHFVIFVIFLSDFEHLIGYNTGIRLPPTTWGSNNFTSHRSKGDLTMHNYLVSLPHAVSSADTHDFICDCSGNR